MKKILIECVFVFDNAFNMTTCIENKQFVKTILRDYRSVGVDDHFYHFSYTGLN